MSTMLVDLHAHILPGLDDGARDMAQALAMLRIAEEDGVGVVVATPHSHHARAAATRAGVERLNAAAAERGIGTRVMAGHEARIGPGMVERWTTGDLLTIGAGPWMLVELYLHDEWPLELVSRALGRLRDAGLRPLLAHVERYPLVQRDPLALLPFIERGILMQVNAGALGYRSDDVERVTAETLVRARMAHVIASDAHNDGYRAPRLRAALERAAEIAGQDYAEWMAAVAGLILNGDEVSLPQPVAEASG